MDGWKEGREGGKEGGRNNKANKINCQQLGNLGEEYMGVLCTILATFLLSLILFF